MSCRIVQCPVCEGSGRQPIGEHFVTPEMASDAGQPERAGESMGIEYGPCSECGGHGVVYPEAIQNVIAEREAQDQKWGQQDHSPMVWNAILGEEVGEVARAILEGNIKAYAKELIQVAAVAVAAAEALERWRFEIPDLVAEQLAKKAEGKKS